MKKSTLLLIVLLIVTAGIVFWYIQRDTHPAVEHFPESQAPASWFDADSTLAPSDSIPFNSPNATPEAFHLWAWQKFLSLTRTAANTAPFQEYVQVDNDLVKLGSTIELIDSTQAGTGGVLYDTTARAIYYTLHVNKTMYDFQQENLDLFAPVYAKYKGLSDRDAKIQHALDSLGYDTLNYPVGAVELKTSWIMASSLKSTADYYTTYANVHTANGIRSVKVALLGMHVIGRVVNHPEFIWATFEHDDMVPDYSWAQPGYPLLGDTLSDKNYLFYQQNNVIGNCLMNNNSATFAGFSNIFNIYPLGIARSFTGSNVPNKQDRVNDAIVRSLNRSVKRQLAKCKEVWQHYFYKGAIWLNFPNTDYRPGNGNLGLLTRKSLNGNRAVSNSTMETFAQVNFSGNYTTGSMNCFGCHATVDYKNVQPNTNDSISFNLALSHLFKNALLKAEGD